MKKSHVYHQPYTFRGMEAGYDDCRAECRRLAKTFSEAQIREMAAKLYVNLHPAPPPSSDEPKRIPDRF
jgi:hypothetical protein